MKDVFFYFLVQKVIIRRKVMAPAKCNQISDKEGKVTKTNNLKKIYFAAAYLVP
jgi:hypothetical protein